MDLEEDWSDVEVLCGSESLCCLSLTSVAAAPLPTVPSVTELVEEPIVEAEEKPDASATDELASSSVSTSGVRRSERVKKQTRFQTVVDDTQLSKAILERVPRNTARSTSWDVSVFEEWCEERNIDVSLASMSDVDINSNVARFVHEVVKKDRKTPYPPNSLYQIVVSIQHFLKENGRPDVNFLNYLSSKSLDARMKALSNQGYGVVRRRAQPITRDMENILWEKGIFLCVTSTGLLNVVYFYNCKLFGLRAGDEHRALCIEQFSFNCTNGDLYMQFTGCNSKTYQGGLANCKVTPKVLKIYSKPELGERNIVSCYQLYLNCIPSEGPF